MYSLSVKSDRNTKEKGRNHNRMQGIKFLGLM